MPAKKPTPPKKAAPARKAVAKAPARKPRASASKKEPAQAKKSMAPKVLRFIDEYLVDLNGSAAYKRAGYKATGNSAEVNARRLLRNAQVSAEIARRQSATAQKLAITREEVLQEAWDIVKADPRELVEHVVLCCRHCHGNGFAWQWVDDDEHQAACEQAVRDHDDRIAKHRSGPQPVLKLPSDIGGYGFDPRRSPHPDCPKCQGHGQGKTVIKDTRTLSRAARALFAGIKETKEGFEVKMHSKLDAMEKVFKHLGMYDADKPPAANVSVHVGNDAAAARPDLEPGEAYLIMVQGQKR